MRNSIPKIIHQIWSGIEDPLPQYYKDFSETWKCDYPDWEYILWDNGKMNSFVLENYPEYWDAYNQFPYNIQRWDAIRYLILYKMGGMYVDFDYESVRPMGKIIENNTCCFSQEPVRHRSMTEEFFDFNNALMLSIPQHFFMMKIIDTIFSNSYNKSDKKYRDVFGSTGPWIINRIYNSLSEDDKEQVYIIPSEYVSPYDMVQSRQLREGDFNKEIIRPIRDAYAIHYYYGEWNNSES